MWPFPNLRKQFLSSLKLGSKIYVKVEESIANNHALVNFQGHLVLVKNKSGLIPGQEVFVRVIQLEPELIFEIVEEKGSRDTRRSIIHLEG